MNTQPAVPNEPLEESVAGEEDPGAALDLPATGKPAAPPGNDVPRERIRKDDEQPGAPADPDRPGG